MVETMGWAAAKCDCTCAPGGGETALAEALDRIRQDAENAVRAGCEHLVLSDEAVGPDRVDVPMILATGAVHTTLIRQKLRPLVSLHVRSLDSLPVHSFPVLTGVAAPNTEGDSCRERVGQAGRISVVA